MTAVEILLMLFLIFFILSVSLGAGLIAACWYHSKYAREKETYINGELQLLIKRADALEKQFAANTQNTKPTDYE